MAAETPISDNVTETTCKNCGTSLVGRFCSRCGQPDKHVDPSLHDLFHEVVHEFAHLDGKIVWTLKALIFKPGKLSADFFAGRRASYIGPVRLYLTFSVIFFLVLALQHTKSVVVGTVDGKAPSQDEMRKAVDAEMSKPGFDANSFHGHLLKMARKMSDEPELVQHKFVTNASRTAFLLVPMFALGLLLAYKNRKKHYPTFIYFSLHFHAFAFLAMTLYLVAGLIRVDWLDLAVGAAVFVWIPVYLFVSLRRTFGGSRVSTLVRMAGLSAFYLPCYVLVFGIAGVVTVYTI